MNAPQVILELKLLETADSLGDLSSFHEAELEPGPVAAVTRLIRGSSP